MDRRASLPGADELFRPTGHVTPLRGDLVEERPSPPPEPGLGEASGRTRHESKITVYLTEQELLDLEQARLRLRAEFGISVDRGRIVREGVAELLRDLRDAGPDAALVRRLS